MKVIVGYPGNQAFSVAIDGVVSPVCVVAIEVASVEAGVGNTGMTVDVIREGGGL